MKMKRLNFYLLGVLAILVFMLPGKAEAFCIENKSSAKVHVVALDSSRYQADINPKGKTCCGPNQCGKKQSKKTSILAVTRYVPVAKDNRPGWQAQCKASLKPNDTLVIRGNDKKISCN